jgi:hypothetical protein
MEFFHLIDSLYLRISDNDKMYGHICMSFVVFDLLALPAWQPGVTIGICLRLELTCSLFICVSNVWATLAIIYLFIHTSSSYRERFVDVDVMLCVCTYISFQPVNRCILKLE